MKDYRKIYLIHTSPRKTIYVELKFSSDRASGKVKGKTVYFDTYWERLKKKKKE